MKPHMPKRLAAIACSFLLTLDTTVSAGLGVMTWTVWTGVGAAARAAEPAPKGAPASEVEYRRLLEAGPQSIHVVRFDLGRGDLAVAATVGRSVRGNETVPAMVARLPKHLGRPLAAINGDYFEFKGEPRYFGTLQGMCIVEGELVASPPAIAFWIDAQARPRLGRVASRLEVIWPVGKETPISVNCSTRDFKSEVRAVDTVLYTPFFGPSTRTAEGTREWVLQRPTPDAPWLPLVAGKTYAARVSKTWRTGDATIPRDGLILSVANAAAGPPPTANVDDTVKLRIACDPDMTGVRTAIAGEPMLLADGKVLTNPAGKDRAPRTAVGLAGNRVWFVVVDGRQPAKAVGMSHHELAGLMKRLGCTDALNLDGGGSSTLWYEGEVRNQPSDGTPRSVGNALILLQSTQQGEKAAGRSTTRSKGANGEAQTTPRGL
ncbi:MAG: phosphodiester glycosidase family protein [Planctomycetes bacterium]|nr:phosphodiester glycosidase family protein [Planctomycetota bacterium]